MQNLIECSEKIKGDQYLYDSFIKDGTDIQVKSIAQFEGFECRVWSPEFHGIMLDSAITHAREAEILRRKLQYNLYDGVLELTESTENTENSFKSIQHSLNCIVMSIACLEAWVNKTIRNELSSSLKFIRTNKEEVFWGAPRIEKDSDLLEKLFIVIPLIFGISPVKEHVTVRLRIKELISDRNSLMHMKQSPKIGGENGSRRNLALKLLRRNSLLVIKNTISPIKMLYEKSNKEVPVWLSENIATLALTEKQIQKI